MISNIEQFRKTAKQISDTLNSAVNTYENFVYDGVRFFNDHGNKNVEVLQTLVAVAYNAQGIRAKTVIDWISNIIPHKVEKDRNHTHRYTFTGKIKEATYPTLADLEIYIKENPLFEHAHKDKAPDQWTQELANKKLNAALNTQIKKTETALKTDPFNETLKEALQTRKLLQKILNQEIEVMDETEEKINILTDVAANNDLLIAKMEQQAA